VNTTVRKFKLFGPHEDENQESWLRSMAQQGLHLVKVNPFCVWTFRRGEPDDVVYRVDFPNASHDPDFRQLMEDAGWTLAATTVGWHYWRTRAVNGRAPELFTDNASKAAKFKQRLGVLVGCSIPFLVSIVVSDMPGRLGELSLPFLVAYGAALCFYLSVVPWAIVRLALRIRQLSSPATAN